jgi:hypothetical protein
MHSNLVGGSTAGRRIACPASFAEALKAPPGTTSSYAEAGTALHEAQAYWSQHPDADLVGMTFNDLVISAEDVDNLLTPAWDALVDLQEHYGGGFKITHLEQQVQFPGIPGAFGTVDATLESATHFMIGDFKFGAGVQVPCVYEDDSFNPQLLFYLSSCRHQARGRTMVIAIIQPTFEPILSHAVVTPQQLDAFEQKLQHAIALALSDSPPRARGEHCRFAPCKATCSLWSGPLLDLSMLGKPAPRAATAPQWGEFLAAAKRLVDSALAYQKEIDSALMDHLKAGGHAPGFALKPQIKNRKWLDDADFVAKRLKKLGLPDDKIWQHKLQTFQVTDAAAKKLNVSIPDELRPRPISSEFVLTYVGDPAAVDVIQQRNEFSAALKRIGKSA